MTKRIPRLHLSVPRFEELAQAAREQGLLRDEELLIVDAVAPRYGETDPMVLLGLAFALRAVRVGHAGVDLRNLGNLLHEETPRDTSDDKKDDAAKPDEDAPSAAGGAADEDHTSEEDRDDDGPPQDLSIEGRLKALGLPTTDHALAQWESQVLSSPLVSMDTGALTPFYKQARGSGSWLLLTQRMAREQERLALELKKLASAAPAFVLKDAQREKCIAALFGEEKTGVGADAVRRSMKSCLSIVTGGPGTGKTYSIKRLVALLLDANRDAGGAPLRIELAAPTGKAAVRMREALVEKLHELPCSPAATEELQALEARTVHKLLGIRPDGTSRYGADLPLPADLVIIDEASMVGLVLMRRLVESIGAGTRLVLLGDRDQLASVDAGTVLADLVYAGDDAKKNALLPLVTRFTHSYRHETAEAVASVSSLLQTASPASITAAGSALMKGGRTIEDQGLLYLGAPTKGAPSKDQLEKLAAPYYEKTVGYAWKLGELLKESGQHSELLADNGTHTKLLELLENYRVLAVHRRGALGVAGLLTALSARVRKHLEDSIKTRRDAKRAEGGSGSSAQPTERLLTYGGYWLGEPVLITRNDYELDLRNGDIGLVLPDANGRLGVVFAKKRRDKGDLLRIAIERLPANMGALAMTVHKAQGSQFKRVALVLAGHDSAIQTRELVYTAITRSQAKLDWLGSEKVLRAALDREVNRASGLRELLQA